MAFIIPKKPSTSNSSTPSSSFEDETNPLSHDVNVTSHLYLKPKGSNEAADGRSFEKEVVLRRIRHRKRVNRIQGAMWSFFTAKRGQEEKEREADGWLEDAFSSP
ncbi:uncharacterized protein A4U43_C03F8350 [Asparagus officinalis]|uniref:Uncharacterized protein n=1 Tax=Asparagus officinalis TaxID=4686 RepID=A0A5P1FCN9_ASPOF|nr:uncharacterized protein A4U43_C03F8350 [Asparagus officinalis]